MRPMHNQRPPKGSAHEHPPILVTAEREAGKKLANALRKRGLSPIVLPCIRVLPPEDDEPLLQSLARVQDFDWIVITSSNGANALEHALELADRRSLPSIAAVGPATAKKLESAGFVVTIVPEHARSDVLLADLVARGVDSRRILLPLGNLADDRLERGLKSAGAIPLRVEAYRTIEGVEDIGTARRLVGEPPEVEIVAHMSGSAARGLLSALGLDLFASLRHVCIGPRTAAEVEALGSTPEAIALPHTVVGLVEAVVEVTGVG